MMHDFQLGGVVVPLETMLDFEQSYEPFGGASVLRMMDGTAVPQTTWRKRRTRLSATGWVPLGLESLSYDAALVLKCAKPLAISSASNVITLPAGRRADFTPLGFAIGADRLTVETSCGVSVNTATLGVVSGAIGYRVIYVPEFSVVSQGPQERLSLTRAEYSWELVCEEA